MSDTVAINLPGKFCDWFDGTNLAQKLDDSDPECKETRIAYDNGLRRNAGNNGYYVRMQANSLVLRILAEYATYCLDANEDDPVKSEIEAAKKVLERVHKAQKGIKEKS